MSTSVMVAMSGGVDSSAAALLLLQQGYRISGGTMTLFSKDDILCDDARTCGASDSVNDAKAVCDKLGIDHYVFDFAPEFRHHVIDRFADCYMRGETPNPCIDCNRSIKFRCFADRAASLGYGHIATGHYARVEYDSGSGRFLLKKAADCSKDQTYMLYSLTQETLSRTLLPLGSLHKSEIRELAAAHGFVNADKPDSQDICFVPSGDYAAFLEQALGLSLPQGEFVRDDGRVVGIHKGLHHYTVGQRKGLGIAAEKPLYVLKKDIVTNRVILGDNSSLFTDSLIAADCNWIACDTPTASLRVTAKTRYSQSEAPATVTPLDNGRVHVRFDTHQRAITAGQAVVFYDGDTVVGGGTITTEV